MGEGFALTVSWVIVRINMNKYLDKRDFNTKFKEGFTLVCKKCGSDDCVLNYEDSYYYSDLTNDPGSLSIGCNKCQLNDIYQSNFN